MYSQAPHERLIQNCLKKQPCKTVIASPSYLLLLTCLIPCQGIQATHGGWVTSNIKRDVAAAFTGACHATNCGEAWKQSVSN